MSADNVLGREIVLKISNLPSKLRFSAKYSFFGQSLSRGHYQPTYQPPEGIYLLISIITQVIIEIRALLLAENGVIFRYNHLRGGEYSERTNFLNLMKESAIPRNTKHVTKFGMTLFKGKM